YGQATWPTHEHEIAAANESFERAVEVTKAWREQFHRHIAAGLGVVVLLLALLATRKRRFGMASILVAAGLVAASIPVYMGVDGVFASDHVTAMALFLAAEALLLVQALRWSNADGARLSTIVL